jgi:hypothetical protein
MYFDGRLLDITIAFGARIVLDRRTLLRLASRQMEVGFRPLE